MEVYQKVASVRTDMVLFYCIVLLDAECLFLLGKALLKHLLLDLVCGGDILIHIRTHNAIKIRKLKNNSTFFLNLSITFHWLTFICLQCVKKHFHPHPTY